MNDRYGGLLTLFSFLYFLLLCGGNLINLRYDLILLLFNDLILLSEGLSGLILLSGDCGTQLSPDIGLLLLCFNKLLEARLPLHDGFMPVAELLDRLTIAHLDLELGQDPLEVLKSLFILSFGGRGGHHQVYNSKHYKYLN